MKQINGLLRKGLQSNRQQRNRLRIFWGVIALTWSGLLYPELCFSPYTCQAYVVENGREIPVEIEDVEAFLTADSKEIIISSKFLEWWKERYGKQHDDGR